jgi:hypothetical protein
LKVWKNHGQIQLESLEKILHTDVIVMTSLDFSTVTRILPRNIRELVREDDISAMHKALTGMDATQANIAFMEVLRNWPLYGATMFEVSVSNF